MKIRALGVSELNQYVSRHISLDPILSNLKLVGEISDFKLSSLGNAYFTMSDSDSSVSCMMFQNDYLELKRSFSDGEYVEVSGRVQLYSKRGQYQVQVKEICLKGDGVAKIEFEKLKSKLDKEGMFSSKHKLELKKYPQKIAVVTSEHGAALQDVINILNRRAPYLTVAVFPTVVQGKYAPENIVKSLEIAKKEKDIDALILTRGGGSDEDLSAFNDESVVRALFLMPYPVISAIGHEIDSTLCDYVADMRAPTPSAAAELVAPDFNELILDLTTNFNKIYDMINYHINQEFRSIEYFNPVVTATKIKRNIDIKFNSLSYFEPANVISRINSRIKNDDLNLELTYSKLIGNANSNLKQKNSILDICGAKLHSISPLSTLNRGYSLVEDQNSNIIGFDDIELNDEIKVLFDKGHVICNVKDKIVNNKKM